MPAGWRLVLFGGDGREVEAAAHMARLGHAVLAVGQRGGRADGGASPSGIAGTLAQADAVVGPALGTNAAGDAFHAMERPIPIDPAWLDACAPGTPWLIGRAGPWLRTAAAARGMPIETYADRDEFATLNAVPTAEGAIAEAGRLAGRTLWGEAAVVVGGGRCALALVPRLAALGCRVALVARHPAERARAAALGAETADLGDLAARAGGCSFVFNTVPALLVSRTVLAALPEGAVVADLASAPGGTDFVAAAALGVRAALLPGIPGRLFPKTAGRIVAAVVLDMLAELARGGDGDARI